MLQEFEGARRLLSAVEEEARQAGTQLPGPLAFKLGRLVSWEVLLGSVVQFLAEWPTQLPGTADTAASLGQGALSESIQIQNFHNGYENSREKFLFIFILLYN